MVQSVNFGMNRRTFTLTSLLAGLGLGIPANAAPPTKRHAVSSKTNRPNPNDGPDTFFRQYDYNGNRIIELHSSQPPSKDSGLTGPLLLERRVIPLDIAHIADPTP